MIYELGEVFLLLVLQRSLIHQSVCRYYRPCTGGRQNLQCFLMLLCAII